jgi:hypothetical protein
MKIKASEKYGKTQFTNASLKNGVTLYKQNRTEFKRMIKVEI